MEKETSVLQPLPLHDYDSSEVALRICSIDGFLDFETNRYSVPYEYVADILTLKATEQEVFIYSPEIEVVAHHERLPQGAGKTSEKPEHRTSKKSATVLNRSETLSSPLAIMQKPSFPGSKTPSPETPASRPALSFTSKKPIMPMTSTWPCTMPFVTKPLRPRPSNASSWQKPTQDLESVRTNRQEKSWKKHCPASSNVPR